MPICLRNRGLKSSLSDRLTNNQGTAQTVGSRNMKFCTGVPFMSLLNGTLGFSVIPTGSGSTREIINSQSSANKTG